MNKNRILIFDIILTGHHSEYISHLIDILNEKANDNEYYIVVGNGFSNLYPKIWCKAKGVQNIIIIEDDKYDTKVYENISLLKKSFIEYKIMDYYANKFKVMHTCLMYFNTFQLALIFKKPKYKISGILFMPFYRNTKSNIIDKINYLKKYWLLKLSVVSVNNIFVLNDQKAVDYFNNVFGGDKFKMLDDPIPSYDPIIGLNIKNHYEIESHRKIFLHIGSLGMRKGTFDFLDSIAFLSQEVIKNSSFLFIGKAENTNTFEVIDRSIHALKKIDNISIIWDNNFVSNEFMKTALDQCYSVVLPYKNVEGSSGILGHAASAQKKVIITGKGLLKEIVQDYKLGYLIYNNNPVEIAKVIDNAFYSVEEFDLVKLDSFVASKKISKFSRTILHCLNS